MTSRTDKARRAPGYALRAALLAIGSGLGSGFVLHSLAVFLRDAGPAGSGWSLRGNGALVVLPLAALVLIAGALLWCRQRAWYAVVCWPLALVAGLGAGVCAGGVDWACSAV